MIHESGEAPTGLGLHCLAVFKEFSSQTFYLPALKTALEPEIGRLPRALLPRHLKRIINSLSRSLKAGHRQFVELVLEPVEEEHPGKRAQILVAARCHIHPKMTVFDIHTEPGALNGMGMALEHCQALEGGLVWLRYRFSWDTLTQHMGDVVQR